MNRLKLTDFALPLAMAALLIAGCNTAEDVDPDTEQAAAAPRDALTSVPLGTFTADAPVRTDAGFDTRLPADPAHTILVASTTLFPGMQRIEPNIENPYDNREGIAAGERHFAAFNCSGCHAPLGGGGMGPPLSDAEWIYGDQPAQLYLSIMQGRPAGMPAFSSMLPGRTVWELVAYVRSLQEIEDYAAVKGFDVPSPLERSSAAEPREDRPVDVAAR